MAIDLTKYEHPQNKGILITPLREEFEAIVTADEFQKGSHYLAAIWNRHVTNTRESKEKLKIQGRLESFWDIVTEKSRLGTNNTNMNINVSVEAVDREDRIVIADLKGIPNIITQSEDLRPLQTELKAMADVFTLATEEADSIIFGEPFSPEEERSFNFARLIAIWFKQGHIFGQGNNIVTTESGDWAFIKKGTYFRSSKIEPTRRGKTAEKQYMISVQPHIL